ncbi:MAG: hypothetical protein IJW13_04370 [Clostridia bacterium]|nr:hypothetical protein [Clostridia bacterium]
MDDFAKNIQTAKEQYDTVSAYAKDESGRLTLTTVETYLTANLTTKEPYEVTQTPTESINLYIVGDFIITNFTLVTSNGTQSKEYVLSGELTVAEFIRSVLMIDNWWNYKVEKDGKEITTNELFAEKVCEGNYTVTQINK